MVCTYRKSKLRDKPYYEAMDAINLNTHIYLENVSGNTA
jgi:hypothetical protein